MPYSKLDGIRKGSVYGVLAVVMKFSIITPNYIGERYLRECIDSVWGQRDDDIEVEHIVVDGASKDASLSIIETYRDQLAHVVSEPDTGPANAINKGLALATGDVLAWLNADDYYYPGALKRAAESLKKGEAPALCFGRCRIVGVDGHEIRGPITRFKESFFPLSSRFTIQCINYISQPAMFFCRDAFESAGPLREDMQAAWDYEFILRLWRQGGGRVVGGAEPLSAFRWHEGSISGQHYRTQFREEWAAAAADAGRFSPQAALHLGVRFGIVSVYSAMARIRSRPSCG